MSKRAQLVPWVLEALTALGGKGTIVEISQMIDRQHGADIKALGDLYWVWHYEMRWAGDMLVKQSKIAKGPPAGTWQLLR